MRKKDEKLEALQNAILDGKKADSDHIDNGDVVLTLNAIRGLSYLLERTDGLTSVFTISAQRNAMLPILSSPIWSDRLAKAIEIINDPRVENSPLRKALDALNVEFSADRDLTGKQYALGIRSSLQDMPIQPWDADAVEAIPLSFEKTGEKTDELRQAIIEAPTSDVIQVINRKITLTEESKKGLLYLLKETKNLTAAFTARAEQGGANQKGLDELAQAITALNHRSAQMTPPREALDARTLKFWGRQGLEDKQYYVFGVKSSLEDAPAQRI